MRKVLQQLGQYKRDTFRCIGLTALEGVLKPVLRRLCREECGKRGVRPFGKSA